MADVCPDAETALLLAILVRALVLTAGTAARNGRPVCHPARETIRASLNAAARHGLTGPAIDPFTGDTTDPWTMVYRLAEHTGDALTALGDDELADRLLRAVATRGGGAERQRAAWHRARSPGALVAELAATTAAGPLTVNDAESLAHGC